MRVVAIERAPIPRWYDHAIVWCAIVTAQVVAAAALVRGLGLGTGPWRAGLVGALVAWCLVVDVRYLGYRRAIDADTSYDDV